ncbi:MAG TPA: cold shock domain-containing protein [Rhodanobacter sp.]|nr:cold shock domain-containing protein [Rhodanobacter sp.]
MLDDVDASPDDLFTLVAITKTKEATCMRTHGTLVKWNDDRGFGFIEPAAGTEEVFVHVSAFPREASDRASANSYRSRSTFDRTGKNAPSSSCVPAKTTTPRVRRRAMYRWRQVAPAR